jgi:xylan 1,4-beta-xylosidase
MSKILINPLNIDYKFQHYLSGMGSDCSSGREAADPTLVLFKDTYYLFTSMTAGFFYSPDLFDWSYKPSKLEMYAYAPDARVIDGKLYFCASHGSDGKNSSIFVTEDPLKEDFKLVSSPFAFWDPDLFEDDDGKVYLFWSCSNNEPIKGQEFDKKTMLPIGEKKELFMNRYGKSGWEQVQFYQDRKIIKDPQKRAQAKLIKKYIGDKPYIEGAFMTKHDGKYYLQYACPGTQYYAYGDGVYVSDKPLGPYTVQDHNPFSSKPSGFINAAGHGSTIQDKFGNWWHVATMRISVNANFERRVGLFPAGFDKDGILFCNQNFADYPLSIPDGKFDPLSIQPKWMLLSYKKPARVSSFKKSHEPKKAVDEDVRTWWAADTDKPGEWIKVDLKHSYKIHLIQVNFADEGVVKPTNIPEEKCLKTTYQTRYLDDESKLYTRYVLQGSNDNKKWTTIVDKSKAETNFCHDVIELKEPVRYRYIKVTGVEFPYHSVMAISGLRVFGDGEGKLPVQAKASAVRTSGKQAIVHWKHVQGSIGANIRYGVRPDKLYSSVLVYEKDSAVLNFLDCDQPVYFCAVDVFNEKGITKGRTLMIVQDSAKKTIAEIRKAANKEWSLYYLMN